MISNVQNSPSFGALKISQDRQTAKQIGYLGRDEFDTFKKSCDDLHKFSNKQCADVMIKLPKSNAPLGSSVLVKSCFIPIEAVIKDFNGKEHKIKSNLNGVGQEVLEKMKTFFNDVKCGVETCSSDLSLRDKDALSLLAQYK